MLSVSAGAFQAIGNRPSIHITAADIAQLTSYWQAQSLRPPTQQELTALIQDRVNEEVLYREAVRLGLDRDDVIVRRRLAQKLSFLNQDLAEVPNPSLETLRAFYESTRAAYSEPESLTLEQVYFSPESNGAHIQERARAALHRLSEIGDRSPAAVGIGDPFMLPLTYADISVHSLAQEYGAGFADAVKDLPTDTWSGPIQSAFGVHLVRVVARRGAFTPPFEDVVDRVRDSYLAKQRDEANTTRMNALRQKYDIAIDDQGAATSP